MSGRRSVPVGKVTMPAPAPAVSPPLAVVEAALEKDPIYRALTDRVTAGDAGLRPVVALYRERVYAAWRLSAELAFMRTLSVSAVQWAHRAGLPNLPQD